ncbi:hypothetical protein HPB51_028889 [Rhipicephalus microplus]|uniref:Uncharacterized protein n=1 Tax=Rhipicephalus microplus TaxID=6941 RepID=A0A9J6CVN3_RHIMP|nr:hypothetical protein HPB51_028889 [Rhipicephalus microplus]
MGLKLYCGPPVLATDTKTVEQRLNCRVNLYEFRKGHSVTPEDARLGHLQPCCMSAASVRTFVQPIAAGLDPVTKPYICVMNLIGCIDEPTNFVISDTCEEQCYGMCETLWEPDHGPDELFEASAQALMNAL